MARIEFFLIDGDDYFVAILDNGSARVGLRGANCFDFPVSHTKHDDAILLVDEAEAEEYHDELMSIYG